METTRRDQGRTAAQQHAEATRPSEVLDRVAWAAGWRDYDPLPEAVAQARAAGCSWPQIGAAVGITAGTAQTRFGTGRERQQRYRTKSAEAERNHTVA